MIDYTSVLKTTHNCLLDYTYATFNVNRSDVHFLLDLLQIRRTSIKAPMSLNFAKIPSPFKELAALEHLKN